ncbi:uncharacterized protein LOC127722375 [Mytilus californianus]|uniref:uncharacterized protein LOC127722375 n=1 Tax=Mytilus californianus TaxID=6549 RepID=UPI0022480453|nr:uncharacterized protein LOC127722375 [Mytilus californianus]
MYISIIFVVSFFSVIDLKNADCAVVYQCYWFVPLRWTLLFENNAVTNNWCEDQCKAHATNYQYAGTISNKCFCGKVDPEWIDSTSTFAQCTEKNQCPGDISEFCGGYYKSYTVTYKRITVSKIERSTETVTVKRDSATAAFITMIPSDASPATVSKSNSYTIRQDLSYTTSENANTAISTVMTENTTNATKGMRPRKLLCKCPKRLINTKWHVLDGKNITNSEVKKIVLEDFNKNVKSEITVDKKTVSKEERKKHSSVNKRKSAQSIGWGCIVFVILPMGFLIAIDILNCCIHFQTYLGRRKRNRIRAISNIQDQSDSSKPLQENVSITKKFYASKFGNNFHPDEMKQETYQRIQEDQHSRMEWMQYI